MIHYDLFRSTMNSSLDLLASLLDQLNLWAHHNLIFKPYLELFPLTILSRSWSIIDQLIGPSMKNFEFIQWTSTWSHLIHHIDFIMIILDSIIELNLEVLKSVLLLLIGHNIFITSAQWFWCISLCWWNSFQIHPIFFMQCLSNF